MVRDIENRLKERFGRFIRQEVAKGRFQSEAEVVEAALELLEERETRLAKLRAELQEAEQLAPPSRPPSARGV